jgi:predicted kinase
MTDRPDRAIAKAADMSAAARSVREAMDAGPCLVLLVGPAGSGKSTLARQAEPSTGRVLSLDALRAVVSGDEWNQDATGDAVAALHLLADARLRRRLATLIDATNVEARARRPLLAMARRHGVPATAVVLATSLEDCLARNAARPGPAPGARWGRRVPEALVRRQHDQLCQALPSLTAEGLARVIMCVP